MKKTVLLVSSLVSVLASSTYAQPLIEIKDTSDPIEWEIDLTPDEGQAEKVTLNQYFEAGCVLFGVHDALRADSELFCIRQKPSGKIRGKWIWNGLLSGADFEGLDYNGSHLFLSSGDDAKGPLWYKGRIWRSSTPSLANCNFTDMFSPLAHEGRAMVDGTPMEEVDGITFDSSGNLYGWAQESGLFVVPSPVFSNLGNAELVFPQPGEVEDLELLNYKFYGVLNLDHLGQVEDGDGEPHPNHPEYPEDINAAVKEGGLVKANFVEYDLGTGASLKTPCEQTVINRLAQAGFSAAEIEALEILPRLPGMTDDYLLLGFHTSPPPGKNLDRSALVLGVLNLGNCGLDFRSIRNIPGSGFKKQRLDVEGLAMVCPAAD